MAFRKSTVVMVAVIAVIGLLLAVSTIGVLGAPKGSGSVQVINGGVYSDSDCTVNCTAIDWGRVSAGGSVSRTIYVKNLGSSMVYLKISTSGWSPVKASSLMRLSWNMSSYYPLSVGTVVAVTFTLKAAANLTGLTDFSFNIVIAGVVR